MQIKSMAMMAIAGCVIALSTGCVKQEEYDAMVQKLTDEKTTAVNELQTKLADTESLLNAEKDRTRTLNNDLRDSTVLNDELKDNVKEMKTSLATANSQISTLESQLASAKASIKSAQDMASEAQNDASTARMEAQETQRRFDELIANLIALNKIKPEDVGFDNLSSGGSSAPAMDMGGMDMGDSSSAASGSAADLLDAMGDM